MPDTLQLQHANREGIEIGVRAPDAAHLSPPATEVVVEQADGWLLVSKFMRPRPVVPPYAYDYSYTHYDRVEDADEHYRDQLSDPASAWRPVAIIPCKRGVPLGSKVL